MSPHGLQQWTQHRISSLVRCAEGICLHGTSFSYAQSILPLCVAPDLKKIAAERESHTWQREVVESVAPALLTNEGCQGCIAKGGRCKGHASHMTSRCLKAVELMQQAQCAQLCYCSPQGMACSTPLSSDRTVCKHNGISRMAYLYRCISFCTFSIWLSHASPVKSRKHGEGPDVYRIRRGACPAALRGGITAPLAPSATAPESPDEPQQAQGAQRLQGAPLLMYSAPPSAVSNGTSQSVLGHWP